MNLVRFSFLFVILNPWVVTPFCAPQGFTRHYQKQFGSSQSTIQDTNNRISSTRINNDNNNNNNNDDDDSGKDTLPQSDLILRPSRPILFSMVMILSGAILGPFLDAYHSAFGVLEYDEPIKAILWGSQEYPALITTWWVPPLFGLAGFLIGWLYILLDRFLQTKDTSKKQPSVPKILIGISFFTSQYWLSGVLYSSGIMNQTEILNAMSILAAVGFAWLDLTTAGLVTSTATAIGGPLIEMGLISNLNQPQSALNAFFGGIGGYHYNDFNEGGFFPLWIAPIYFMGGPGVGNLARGIWVGLEPKVNDNDMPNDSYL